MCALQVSWVCCAATCLYRQNATRRMQSPIRSSRLSTDSLLKAFTLRCPAIWTTGCQMKGWIGRKVCNALFSCGLQTGKTCGWQIGTRMAKASVMYSVESRAEHIATLLARDGRRSDWKSQVLASYTETTFLSSSNIAIH